MKILALDSSGLVAGVAYLEDGVIKGASSVNHMKTHSQTLLLMVDNLVKSLDAKLDEIDYIAVANGPGSFTGLRIGVATAKGLGFGLDKETIGVSTLEALSLNWQGVCGLVCPIMDARRSQVYTAVYKFGEKYPKPDEIHAPESMMIEDLVNILNDAGETVYFTGDGVPVYRKYIEDNLKVPFVWPTPSNAYQNAANVAVLASIYADEGKAVKAADLTPVYLRKPQAEREREEKLNVCNK